MERRTPLFLLCLSLLLTPHWPEPSYIVASEAGKRLGRWSHPQLKLLLVKTGRILTRVTMRRRPQAFGPWLSS